MRRDSPRGSLECRAIRPASILVLFIMTAVAGGHAIELRKVFEASQPASYAYSVATEPALSPDGRCVAITYSELWPPIYEWWPDVWAVGIDGASCAPFRYAMSSSVSYESPAWSLDGTRIAYVADGYDAPNTGIWSVVVGETGTPPPSLIHVTSGEYRDPAWSLDGMSIACVGPGGIYIVVATGGAPSLMIPGGSSPSWGPHGELAFTREGDLWIRRIDGSEQRLVQAAANPAWSPQGIWIAYVSSRSGTPDIWVIASSGGTPVQVTSGPAWDGHPSWSAQGDRLVFESVDQMQSSIWLATNLPDWTLAVERQTWGGVKQMYR